MKFDAVPQLVTIEGDYGVYDEAFMGYEPHGVAELLGIDIDDAQMITEGGLSDDDIDYLDEKYPEYMGQWLSILTTIGGFVVKGVQGIANAVKGAKERKKAAADAAAAKAEADRQARIQAEAAAAAAAEKKAADQKSMLMTMGIPLLGLLLSLKK